MSATHGETVLQKPINEFAKYMKNLIPANIPETYALKPMFESVASEENIRSGVVAFRDFLYLLCDRLITDGHLNSKPQKTNNPTDYPLLRKINQLLIDIGYHGKLAESGDALLMTDIPSFSAPSLRFLTLCGFVFTGIDWDAKKPIILKGQLPEVSYPSNPILLTGLKALSIAAMELRVRFYNNADNLLRCDYGVLKAEDTDVLDVLKDILHSLPEKLQAFALELHQRYTDMGMTCVTLSDNEVHFAYANIENSRRALSIRDVYQKRVWEFGVSMKHGYCLTVRAKKTAKYADVIKEFPVYLQEKIAQGYGCDRKLRNERCQGGCQGIRIPLDGSILEMRRDIETWLDNECVH